MLMENGRGLMKLINQSYQILDFPWFATNIIANSARVSHMSQDRYSNTENVEFIKKLIVWGHLSPFEHCSAQVKITTNRAIANELVRHRHCAFTQESTRYCQYDDLTVIRPNWIDFSLVISDSVVHKYTEYLSEVQSLYDHMINSGIPAEQARGILPLDTATTLVMTANLREWISVFKLRCDAASHPQMIELMSGIKKEFIERLPWLKEAVDI